MNEQMREALQAIETVMEDAYHRRFAECCGNGHGECCGDFIEQWTPEDNKIMETLAPIQRQLSQALASEGQAEPAALMPDWMQYDPTSDVLTLHGKKYAASMFGRNGFLGQPGDLLRLNKSESDTVCLTKVNINQPAEPVAWATFFEDEQVCELFDNKASAEAWRASDDFFRGVQLKPLYTHPPAEVVRSEGWLRAIDEAMVCSHLGVAGESDTYEEAKKKLNALICWHVGVATDPAVNGGQKLYSADVVRQLVEALELSDATFKAIRWLRKAGEIKAKEAPRLVETMEVLAGEPLSAIKAALERAKEAGL